MSVDFPEKVVASYVVDLMEDGTWTVYKGSREGPISTAHSRNRVLEQLHVNMRIDEREREQE